MNIQEFTVQRLRQLCEKNGDISMRQLAYQSGIPYSTVKSLLTGQTDSVTLQTLKKLTDGLDITLIEFFNSNLYFQVEQEIK